MLCQCQLLKFNAAKLVLVCLLLLELLFYSWAQVPVIACPDYFRYYSDGSGFFGIITLPSISPGTTKLEVHLSQIGVVQESNPSSLTLYESRQVTTDNFLRGKPITFRVEFPVRNVLPKLVLISVNDAVICVDHDYPVPSTKIKLINNITMKISTSITPFVVRDDSDLGANIDNKLEDSENPFWATKPGILSNPFLSRSQHNLKPFTKAPNTFHPNPNNIFLRPSTSARRTQHFDEVCGRENVVMAPLMRGGSAIQRGQFPWLTAIYRKKGADLTFICGGTLISSRTVISAAHCFLEPRIAADKILVMLGRNNLEALEEPGSEQRQLQSLIIHPEYNVNAISDADIALLHFKIPVSFTQYIAPICLWSASSDVNKIAGFSAVVAGWGADENGGSERQQPKKIETLIAEDNACRYSLQGYQMTMASRSICVSAENNAGPCTGDSGGGLSIYLQGRWTLRGIVSAGLTRHGKCFSHEYYYFCDVAQHMSWINRNMLL